MATIPSQQDFLNTQDLTNAPSVTGVQLNQILTTGTPFTDKGIILWTTDASNGTPNVPDATTYTKWQTYFWGRISNAATAIVTLYYWNPYQGSGALQRWVPLFTGAISTGSITGGAGGLIAAATITGYNIAGLTITDPLISTVSGSKIIASTVPISAIINGAANQILATNVGGTALTWLTDYFAALCAVSGLGAAGQIPIVNTGGTALAWLTDFFALLSKSGIGSPGQLPAVNSGATGLQWYTPVNQKIASTSKTTSALSLFTSGLTANDNQQIAHGLAVVPSYLRMVMVCLASDATPGYLIGDEIGMDSLVASTSSSTFTPSRFGISVDATNINFTFLLGTNSYFRVIPKLGGNLAAFTVSSYAIKAYVAI